LATFATIIVFSAWTLTYVPEVAAGRATPVLGVVEWVDLGVLLLWIALLAIHLLADRHSPTRSAVLLGDFATWRSSSSPRPRDDGVFVPSRSARRWRSIDMPTPTRRLHPGGS
jgi:hypothetical protein